MSEKFEVQKKRSNVGIEKLNESFRENADLLVIFLKQLKNKTTEMKTVLGRPSKKTNEWYPFLMLSSDDVKPTPNLLFTSFTFFLYGVLACAAFNIFWELLFVNERIYG